MLDPFGSNPQDWTTMSWIGNVKWLEISGSRSVHDCGCAEGPSVDTQIHHARNSPHCVLHGSSFADRCSQLTLLGPGEGVGFHLTAIPGHENTGFLSIDGIEEIFTLDWFMDCNVGFFTSSLDSPIEMLSKLSWSGLLPSRVTETGADLLEEPQDC